MFIKHNNILCSRNTEKFNIIPTNIILRYIRIRPQCFAENYISFQAAKKLNNYFITSGEKKKKILYHFSKLKSRSQNGMFFFLQKYNKYIIASVHVKKRKRISKNVFCTVIRRL